MKLKEWQRAIVFLILTCSSMAYSRYYTFTENQQSAWQSPDTMMSYATRNVNQLLQWAFHGVGRPVAPEKYNRNKHFGGWVVDSRDGECYNTRARVLIRDSKQNVEFSNSNPCLVYSGKWKDPYGGYTYNRASEIEIDHVVALKNAYEGGAWAWKSRVRCLFANFLGYGVHLVSSYSRENQQKADKGPDRWMPSDSDYACQHLQNWLMVKFVWNLNMTESEARAIASHVKENHCTPEMFQPTKRLISEIRRNIQRDLEICK